MHGFLIPSNTEQHNENEFFVPPTRDQAKIAMDRLFRFFSESNQMLSSSDPNRGTDHFRLGFLPDAKTLDLRAFLFIVNMNVTFNTFSVQHAYYQKLHEYFEKRLEQLHLSEGLDGQVYEQVKHG